MIASQGTIAALIALALLAHPASGQQCPPLSAPVGLDTPAGTSTGMPIMGVGTASADHLALFLLDSNTAADPDRVRLLASMYIEECALEGVNSDVAFAQMCLETGFLRFGGLVTPEMNNFCGLGATDPAHPGIFFPDMRTGVRAHVQHLKAYGSTEPLAGELVDPRFALVSPRGKSPTIAGLAGTWAADPRYGEKLLEIIEGILSP